MKKKPLLLTIAASITICVFCLMGNDIGRVRAASTSDPERYPAQGNAMDYAVDLKINNLDGPVSLPTVGPVSVAISVNPGSHSGRKADWWLVQITPEGSLKYYDFVQGTMADGLSPTHQGPLRSLSSFEILSNYNLSAGTNTFYFGIDLLPNGVLDARTLRYDYVLVDIPGSNCGDGICDPDEDPQSCPQDCGTQGFCGDGVCDQAIGEDPITCPLDCEMSPVCGNGICEDGEDPFSCPQDCGTQGFCGDGVCDQAIGEDPITCPLDCEMSPVCGNGICEDGEDPFSCPQDCGSQGFCGDGLCDRTIGEDPITCQLDCAPVCGNGFC
ncbi:MAG: hypothetical protein SV775_19135, partial [Thermodesulfobacteriota bacterium]|nr:hypothetical protein [Thermodesulfobacteriota bacterium]